MKHRLIASQKPAPWLRRALACTNSVIPGTRAALLALGILSASNASADVIAGWTTWSDLGLDTYDATLTNGATGQAVGTATGGSGWANWNNAGLSNGASTDGTWGTVATATPPTTDATAITAGVGLVNATTSGEMTFTVTNTSGGDLDLTGFYFDGGETRAKAAGDWSLSILAGSDVTVTPNINSGTLPINLGPTTGNFDTDLTTLGDRTLADGEVVIFQLAFTGGTGTGNGGHNAMIDNVAVTADSAITNKLAITSVPATATAGTDFSVTVQAQDNGGSPLVVTQDTEIQLVASGSGSISGNTATILTGNSSVTLDFVQYTKTETITLVAGRISGDLFSSSAPSSSIDILAGAATQFTVETAADGSGVPVAAQVLNPSDSLTVYAISRDSLGNFVANSADSWSLENITGSVVSGDLVDNTNGSATFTADGVGNTNIRAALTGLPDADSGLITVELFVNRWTGGGGNGSWKTVDNWTGSVLPDLDSDTTDLFFSAPTNSKGSPYLGANTRVRSITFDTDSIPASLNISFVLPGNLLPANLNLETDSPTEPAEINVDAAFSKVLTMGFTPTTEGNQGNLILNDDLLITHDGSANFVLNADITEFGGSYGITKAGIGTLIISGTNIYTGDTVVNGGVLEVDGTSLADSGSLTIDGGVVDVTGTEVVAVLDFGSGPVAENTYGATGSAAGVIDDVHFTGTGVVSVVAFTAGYNTWATANVGGQSPSEDFNLDGVDNGIAYFMNDTGNISLPGIVGGAITWSNGGNIPASAYGTEYVVETSQDLATWTSVDVVDLTTNDDTTLTYTLPTGQGEWFVRLVVTPN